jgi:D-alanine-D-alanine ligase-like ATP-grasp enzyme
MPTDRFSRAAVALGRAGRPGRELAVRLDLIRATGARVAFDRLREERTARSGVVRSKYDAYRELWSAAAAELEAETIDLGDGFLTIRRGDGETTVRGQLVPLDTAVTLDLALDKRIVTRLLDAEKIPTPAQVAYTLDDLETADAFRAAGEGRPIVVKPAAGTDGGSGVTTGVTTPSQLARASLRAARLRPGLIAERQVPGELYRLLFLDGQLLDTVRRSRPAIIGDATHTIAQLIAAQNQQAAARGGRSGAYALRIDLDCVIALAAQGLSPRSVPAAGQRVVVKGTASQNAPDENQTVHEPISPGLVDEARRAATSVGLRLAGVDVITNDLSRPLRDSGGVIIEVNGTPGLFYHYRVADPEHATPVAVRILEQLLRSGA